MKEGDDDEGCEHLDSRLGPLPPGAAPRQGWVVHRTFDREVASAAGVDPSAFVQDSQSRTRRGAVRGLHVRTGDGEGKLVRCSHGAIFDVVVDLRPGSPTYRTWLSFDLDGETQQSIFIPAGCAHGFQSLSEPADTFYRINRLHDPSEDLTIAYDDAELAIPWPLPVTDMSENDRRGSAPLAKLADRLSDIRPWPDETSGGRWQVDRVCWWSPASSPSWSSDTGRSSSGAPLRPSTRRRATSSDPMTSGRHCRSGRTTWSGTSSNRSRMLTVLAVVGTGRAEAARLRSVRPVLLRRPGLRAWR